MVQLVECDSCHLAKSSSPQVWMEHIATHHIVPTEWPSDRAKRLTGIDALRPYSTVADSKKKRKKDSIARPLNSFMIFSQYIRRNVLEVFKEHANADMSKQLGKLWGNLDDHFKDKYHEEAERMARLHDLEFPHYKYQPRKSKRSEHLNITSGMNGQHLIASSPSVSNELYKNNTTNNSIAANSSIIHTNKIHQHSSQKTNGININSNNTTATRIISNLNQQAATLNRPIVQVTCNSQAQPQILQTTQNPISVVSTSVPLIITPASAFNSSNHFDKRSVLDSSKHILCKPISQTTPTTTNTLHNSGATHVSYIANSDSAYSSEIGSSSNSSIPSPAIGDIFIQSSPIKHFIDDRNNSIHHWNVDNRRYYQTPRQASASSVPETLIPTNTTIGGGGGPGTGGGGGQVTPSELKINRKRFYSGTMNECNTPHQKLSCIPDDDDSDSTIELDVIDQNGNKMKLRIENGSKEILKSLLLSNQEKHQMNQAYKTQLITHHDHVQDQISQQAIALENCLYINENDIAPSGGPEAGASANFVEYVLPIQSGGQEQVHYEHHHQIINNQATQSPVDNSTIEHNNQNSTILAFLSDHYSQPVQLIKALSNNINNNNTSLNSNSGQLIMIKNGVGEQQFLQFHPNDLNNNDITLTNMTTSHHLHHQLKLEAELPSDLAALDTASLYRIN